MKLVYEWNPVSVDIKEIEALNDIEFSIRVLSPSLFTTMQNIQIFFDTNDVITDVFVYTYSDHEYRVIVRKDYYEDFILQLMKHRLLIKLQWKEELP